MTKQKPALDETRIVEFLSEQYELHRVEVTFLPIGYAETAIYRVVAENQAPYFMKCKRDQFDEACVNVPVFLREQGVQHIIAPVADRDGRLWSHLNGFHVILYPFVAGHNAFTTALTEQQWFDFGAALKAIHTTIVPAELNSRLHHENYAPHWREMVNVLQERVKREVFDDPMAAQLAAFINVKAVEIHDLVHKAEQFGLALQTQNPEFVLCHSDLHAGNLLIDDQTGLYIVDWDNPILAPKERDLMFIGGGVGGIWNTAQEATLFYQGYGQTEINPIALAYFRYERIIQDIAVDAQQVFQTDAGDNERAQALHYFERWFLPNDVVDMAHQAEKHLPPELRSM
jgi:spectinomycin phosphotransferase